MNLEKLVYHVLDYLPAITYPSGESSQFVLQLCQDLRSIDELAAEASAAELRVVLDLLAAGISTDNVYVASVIVRQCGRLVAVGADPDIAVSRVLDLLTNQVIQCRDILQVFDERLIMRITHVCEQNADHSLIHSLREIDECRNLATNGSTDDSTIEVLKAWMGLSLCARGALEMLCRSREARQAARERAFFLGRLYPLAHLHPEVWKLSRLLGQEDDGFILVIHAEMKVGYRAVAECISSNAQMLSLLQEELIAAFPERLIPSAGKLFDKTGSPQPAWTYYQCTAMRSDGTLASARDRSQLILGSQRMKDIKKIDGDFAIILGPLEVAGGWIQEPTHQIHAAHRPRVSMVDTLSDEQVQHYLNHMRYHL